MYRTKPDLTTVLSALICAACILAGTTFLAKEVSESSLYRQSRFFRSIISQEQLDVYDLVRDSETRSLLFRFIAAVSDAYVNFEMIPYNEVQTFTAVLQSIPKGLKIEDFEYRRRNLIIHGVADSPESYNLFTDSLKSSAHFREVAGHSYLTVDDTVRFEIECLSISV